MTVEFDPATDGETTRRRPRVLMPVADINFLLWRLRSTPSIEKIPVLAMSGRDLDRMTDLKKHCALDCTPTPAWPRQSQAR